MDWKFAIRWRIKRGGAAGTMLINVYIHDSAVHAVPPGAIYPENANTYGGRLRYLTWNQLLISRD